MVHWYVIWLRICNLSSKPGGGGDINNIYILFQVRICIVWVQTQTRQVYNLFQEPVEQPLLGFKIAEEKT